MLNLDTTKKAQRWHKAINVCRRAREKHLLLFEVPGQHLFQLLFQTDITVDGSQVKKHAAIEDILWQWI